MGFCNNVLIISGKEPQVDLFLLHLSNSKGVFSMNEIIADNGSFSNWGTKSDLLQCDKCLNDFIKDVYDDGVLFIDEEQEKKHMESKIVNSSAVKTVKLKYLTTISPNEVFVKRVAAIYPNLNFNLEYYDMDLGYVGRNIYHNDKIIKTYHEYDQDYPNECIEYIKLIREYGYVDNFHEDSLKHLIGQDSFNKALNIEEKDEDIIILNIDIHCKTHKVIKLI